MKIEENVSLKNLTTFQVEAWAKYFVRVQSLDDLKKILADSKFKKEKKFILGAGANVLFAKDFDGVVIKMEIKGKEISKEDSKSVWLKLGAGEDWHETVEYAVKKVWGGIENLALIPGTVGGAVVQNIAAYGDNFKDNLESLEALEISTGKIKIFKEKDCQMGYHTSIFEQELKGQFIILFVTLKLEKNPKKFDLAYSSRHRNKDSIEGELEASAAHSPYGLKDVFQAVVNIRRRKLPDPEKVGTAGSIFLNPIVSRVNLNEIRKRIPDLQYYPANDVLYLKDESKDLEKAKFVKVPAGWLLDEIGWAGKKIGNVSTPEKQALCVTNNGQATAQEILAFTEQMRKDFKKEWGIELKYELEVVG